MTQVKYVLSLLMLAFLMGCSENESVKADESYKKGNYKEAIELYNEYLGMYPRHVKSIYNRGRSYEQLGEYDKALQDFEKVIELDPKNTQALQSIGLDYYRKKDYEQAAYYFDQ